MPFGQQGILEEGLHTWEGCRRGGGRPQRRPGLRQQLTKQQTHFIVQMKGTWSVHSFN